MPSLTRFTLNFALFGVVLYAGMTALDTWVEPKQREMVTTVRLKPKSDRGLTELKLKSDGGPSEKLQPKVAVGAKAGRDTRLVTTLEGFPLAGR